MTPTQPATATPPDVEAADAVRLEGVRKVYGSGGNEVTALAGVDLRLAPGTLTSIMGPSGSGKSTLLQCAAGLDHPTAGRVVIGGRELTEGSESSVTRFRRERIGFVFQSFNLLPSLTAEQNVTLPLRLMGRRVDRQRSIDALTRVGLADRVDHRPAELSGGQQQRVAIARALVTDPDVILADEPTGALDTASGRAVLELLRRAVDELGQTVVMVTHDPVAASYADTVVFLANGAVVGSLDGPTADATAHRLAHLADDDVRTAAAGGA